MTTSTATQTRNTSRVVLAFALLIAAVASILAFNAPPADAAVAAGKNDSHSKSVLYTRACLDFSAKKCALHTVQPGHKIPGSKKLYIMAGYGWKACTASTKNGPYCVHGAHYKKVPKYRTWKVTSD